VRRALIVEQTHSAQFHRFLRAHYELPEQVRVLHAPGPLPLRPGQIHRALMEWRDA
jgi:2-oxoglutarate ferredoxin oxidoreductase subunit alpha